MVHIPTCIKWRKTWGISKIVATEISSVFVAYPKEQRATNGVKIYWASLLGILYGADEGALGHHGKM